VRALCNTKNSEHTTISFFSERVPVFSKMFRVVNEDGDTHIEKFHFSTCQNNEITVSMSIDRWVIRVPEYTLEMFDR
jgi:hypothetical protein